MLTSSFVWSLTKAIKFVLYFSNYLIPDTKEADLQYVFSFVDCFKESIKRFAPWLTLAYNEFSYAKLRSYYTGLIAVFLFSCNFSLFDYELWLWYYFLSCLHLALHWCLKLTKMIISHLKQWLGGGQT